MKKKLNLYIIFVFIMFFIVSILSGIYITKYSNKMTLNFMIKIVTKSEMKLHKKILKAKVDNAIKVISLIKNINDLNKYFEDSDDYIFVYKVYNINGGNDFAKMIFNPNRPDLINKFVSDNYKDAKGFEFRKAMLSQIRKRGYAFVEYYYKKPNSDKIEKKLSYFKYYKPLNIIVASGLYLDELENSIENIKQNIFTLDKEIIKLFIIIQIVIFMAIIVLIFLVLNKLNKELDLYQKKVRLSEKKLRYKLYVDELTKLKSRKSLIENIEKQNFKYLILIDIKDFNSINQSFGTNIGDLYLIKFAKLLKQFKSMIHKSIGIYRIGSDEFVVTSKYDEEETKQLCNRLLNFVTSKSIKIDNIELDINVTIVYSTFANPLKNALITLEIAKYQNKNIISFNDIKHNEHILEIKQLLNTAIEKNQITPYAQPIVNNEGKVIKYELLMRIVTENKVIPPYFLEDAKRLKLYTKISSIMIDKCFEFINETDILCSINIDMQDISNPEIVQKLRYYTSDLNKAVVFEILESESFKNYDLLKDFINEFRSYGVLFAIDDFGSGYSNYREIIELKPDYLKLDGSLIKDIIKSKDVLIILDSILLITKLLNIKTTAEFVENEKIFKRLRAMGVDEFQGYYFAKPTPIDELKD